MMASALTIGMAVFTPLQAGAKSLNATIEITVQVKKIKGTIKSIEDEGVIIKRMNGKNYLIGFFKYSDEQI